MNEEMMARTAEFRHEDPTEMLMKRLLFHELRLIPVHFEKEDISQEKMLQAMTANQELLASGFTLSPKDIIALAQTRELACFPEYVRELHGTVKADPMYPGFPEQVMQMDEAVFRFHQILHYLTTYGLETFSGEPVLKGWLPETEQQNKCQPDKTLLDAKVCALIDADAMYFAPYSQILSKTERITANERKIILNCIRHLTADEMTGVPVKFKENLLHIFGAIFSDKALPNEQKLLYLHSLCQHTGDVFKCIDYVLTRSGFHFRTSQKRLLTKLLESYPADDFKGNLILSDKKSRRTELMLRYIDYPIYARSEAHRQAVVSLRGGELHSWEGQAKALVSAKHADALTFIAKRPGMMLRMMTYLLRNGYSPEDIQNALIPEAGALRTQTIVSILNHFGKKSVYEPGDEAKQVFHICEALLETRLAACETPLKEKKVFVALGEIDPEYSYIEINHKSEMGGYLSSGTAYKIPDDVKRIRFFVYWNDPQRVDVDLHTTGIRPDGTRIDIGWNNHYRSESMAFSGDITHSDAAEYIDLDLESVEIDQMTANIHLYSGKEDFSEVETCFAGCMAVSGLGEEIQLYNPQNCLFVHHLHMPAKCVQYGYIDVKKRTAVFIGKPNDCWNEEVQAEDNRFNLGRYLNILQKAQRITFVDEENQEDADVILVTGKPASDKEISLVDHNFFMDMSKE